MGSQFIGEQFERSGHFGRRPTVPIISALSRCLGGESSTLIIVAFVAHVFSIMILLNTVTFGGSRLWVRGLYLVASLTALVVWLRVVIACARLGWREAQY